jgi:sulfur-oxidizing protein SoxZ
MTHNEVTTMTDDQKPRVRIPPVVRKGEIFEVKTLVMHAMESGQRKDAAGNTIPRKIIRSMDVRHNGKPVFSAKFEPTMAANPYLSFFLRLDEGGTLDFVWNDDDGTEYRASQPVKLA